MDIEQLDTAFSDFGKDIARLEGQVSVLKSNQNKAEKLILKLKKDEENYVKAVELLSVVQKVSREKVKESFEVIVTHALNYIFDSNTYRFELVFTTRGSLPELKFAVKTPDKDEAFDPIDSDGGGINNILSFALRIVLMEISQPKTVGFILSDESFSNLSSEYIENASLFLKEVSKKMNRQIIAISHQQQMLDTADNLLEIK